MPVADFRGFAFAPERVDACGKDLGRGVYWKLFAVENLMRVVVHSVLSVQAGSGWWGLAVSPKIQKDAQESKTRYKSKPWHGTPGAHDIYYTSLWQLNEILRVNSHLFLPVVPDIDQWIARIEQIRVPRNIVGHMNWLNNTDRNRVDVVYRDLRALVTQLSTTGFALAIP